MLWNARSSSLTQNQQCTSPRPAQIGGAGAPYLATFPQSLGLEMEDGLLVPALSSVTSLTLLLLPDSRSYLTRTLS